MLGFNEELNMDFYDALNKYLHSGDYSGLYESTFNNLDYNTAHTLLKVILGSDYSEEDYDEFIDEKMAEDFKRIGTREVFSEEI